MESYDTAKLLIKLHQMQDKQYGEALTTLCRLANSEEVSDGDLVDAVFCFLSRTDLTNPLVPATSYLLEKFMLLASIEETPPRTQAELLRWERENMIDSFTGQYRFLSNFSLVWIHYAGVDYPSVEHAYQAIKLTDPGARDAIRLCRTPQEAKRLSRRLSKFFRKDWDTVKVGIMRDLLQIKFAQQELLQKLLATGDEQLVEGNWWGDRFWGVCRGEGQNMLGKLLMEVREQYAKALSSTVAECEIGED